MVHLVVAALAAVAVTFAARYPAHSGASTAGAVPTYTYSGVAGGIASSENPNYFGPGTSLQTRTSVAALMARPDVASVRAVGAISPVSTFSSGVVAAAASSNEGSDGVKPLADLIDPQQPFVLYTAQPGDSVAGIAEKFGITLRTLLENNVTVNGNNPLVLLGQQLVVPRKDGILYKVGYGETVASIVGQFDNTTEGIVTEYRPNAITDPNKLQSGEYLLLPGATIKPPPPPPPAPEPVAPPGGGGGGGGGGSGGSPAPGSSGIFSYPLAAWLRVSDPFGVDRGGGTYHTGIDLDLYGYHHATIFAACSGTVIKTEYLTYSYGYHVIIDCGQGFTTLYAHMSEIDVTPGQYVSSGTPIGVSGVTGNTTGEHLHFEIRINGAPVNPAAYLNF